MRWSHFCARALAATGSLVSLVPGADRCTNFAENGAATLDGRPHLPRVSAQNAATYLPIATWVTGPDANGSYVVHPSVLDFGSQPFHGHRYWMAINPFTPTQRNQVENPSIYCSDDGDRWLAPGGLTNPLDTQDPGWAFSDPHLFAGPDGQLFCAYRMYGGNAAGGPRGEKIFYRTSRDGVEWSDRVLFLQKSGGKRTNGLISPSILYKDGLFWVYTSNAMVLELRRGETLETLGDPVRLDFGWKNAVRKYHHDEIYYNGKFRAVIQESVNGLRYGESFDGVRWSLSAPFLQTGAAGQWDDTWIYRASFTPTPTGYDLWYSARGAGAPTAFRFARVPMNVSPMDYVPF